MKLLTLSAIVLTAGLVGCGSSKTGENSDTGIVNYDFPNGYWLELSLDDITFSSYGKASSGYVHVTPLSDGNYWMQHVYHFDYDNDGITDCEYLGYAVPSGRESGYAPGEWGGPYDQTRELFQVSDSLMELVYTNNLTGDTFEPEVFTFIGSTPDTPTVVPYVDITAPSCDG